MGKMDYGETWISLSDIMTGLMLVFLFISVVFMRQAQKEKNQLEDIIKDYKETKDLIYKDLKETFEGDLKKWNAEIDSNLVVRFLNPDILFESGKSKLNPEFQNILNEFVPKYLSIVSDTVYENRIAEVRIEGHTDNIGFKTKDPYMGNLKLSQERSANVMEFIRNHPSYLQIDGATKKRLDFWFISSGFSFSKQLDSEKNLVYESENTPSLELSRRVEFKIVPNLDNMFQKLSVEAAK